MSNKTKIELKNDKKEKYQSQEIHIDIDIDYNNFYLSQYGQDVEEAVENTIKMLDELQKKCEQVKELLRTLHEEDCVVEI